MADETKSLESSVKLAGIVDKRVSVSISHIIAVISLLTSASVGYGAYRVRFEDQSTQITRQGQAIEDLTKALYELKIEVVRLSGRMEATDTDTRKR